MEFGCINLVVIDPDEALITYLKMYGTNNVSQIIKIKGLNDTVDVIDGYYLKTNPVHLGLFRPRNNNGRMGRFLEKYGEGIHHIDFHMGQDEFESTYVRLKGQGLKISDKIIYFGKFSEAIFWLEEGGIQGVPVKFATKCYHGLNIWEDTVYLDTPQKFEEYNIDEEYIMPRVSLGTVMVTVKDWKNQPGIWANILSKPALNVGNMSTLEEAKVDDKRGNIFLPVKYRFRKGGAINLYCALNDDAPINKVMAKRGRKVMFHHICSYVTRDKVHVYWRKLEEAGFAMVDPKPLLDVNTGDGAYFYFVHPISTHGVLCEIVSAYTMDEDYKLFYDWSDTDVYMASPDVNQ